MHLRYTFLSVAVFPGSQTSNFAHCVPVELQELTCWAFPDSSVQSALGHHFNLMLLSMKPLCEISQTELNYRTLERIERYSVLKDFDMVFFVKRTKLAVLICASVCGGLFLARIIIAVYSAAALTSRLKIEVSYGLLQRSGVLNQESVTGIC